MTAQEELAQMETLKVQLRQFTDAYKFPFDAAWREFNHRCARSPIRPNLILRDLCWEIESNLWPKKK